MANGRMIVIGAGVVVAAAVAVYFLVGGDDDKSSASNSPSTWAAGVCSDLITWKTSVTDAVTSVTTNPTKSGLQDAADAVVTSTETLTTELDDLGKPETESGAAARQALDTVGSQLETGATTIRTDAGDVSDLQGLTAVLP